MRSKSSINTGWLWILGVVLVCILSRLPQLLSPYFHADYNGDECVLGLMAKHIAEGREFPFYFWGQSYGFCWVEAGLVAIAIKLFGVSLFALKIPMLILWTFGCVFFYVAMAQWTHRIYGFWITCLLIFSPAWMGWSMRARAGYITAFLLSTIVLFVLAQSGGQSLKKRATWIGILLGFIFFAQPIYLLGLLPLLFYLLFKQKDFKGFFICISGFVSVFILGKWMIHVQGNTDYWKPLWFTPDTGAVFFSTFFDRIFNSLIQDAGSQYWPAFIVARTWIIVILMGVGIQVVRWSIKKAGYLSSIFFISFLLILGCTYFVHSEWRYLLSLSVFLILWFGVQSFEWINKNIFSRAIVGLLISFFIVAGIFTAWNYQNEYHYFPSSSNEVPEMQKITKIIEFLKASGVRYVFSLEDDLSWKITYFSKEEILSRWANVHGRQPVYIKAIDQALLNGQRVAVVGNMLGELPAYLIIANDGVPTVVADPYFVYLDPSPVLVMYKLGFQVQRP